MDQKYRLQVDGDREFELNSSDIEQVDAVSLSDNQSHLLHQNKSYSVQIIQRDFDKRQYTVKINGNTHTVSIETPLDQLIKEMGLSLGSNSVEDEIYAPMPGIILEVHVAEGDSVSQGDYLCVLEAMKMENALTAPRDGVIKSVFVTQGETVDKGKLLIEFEENDQ